MEAAEEFDGRIARLDCALLGRIESQSSEGDRRSWLSLQRATRDAKHSFVYLEIGSFLGGSIQQYIGDPKCTRIYSIDERPPGFPAAREMLDALREVAPNDMHKLVCFERDARAVDRSLVVNAPDLCFIDGLHTPEAVVSDFLFCLAVCAPDAAIYFHDDGLLCSAIGKCLGVLKRSNRECAAYKLPGDTFAIALADSPVNTDVRVSRMAVDGKRWAAAMTFSESDGGWVPPAMRPALGRVRDRWLGCRGLPR